MKKIKSGIIVLIILCLCVCGIFGYSFFASKSYDSEFIQFEINSSKNIYKNEYVAKLYILGTIEKENRQYNQKWLLSTIKKLQDDEKNIGLAIIINSPGGAVYQTDEVYLELQKYKSKGKPIFVYQQSLAASGGYYISCAADEIWANRNTMTGSIGVISGNSFDLTQLYENIGIKAETFYSGKNKNMLNSNECVTDEQRQIMQSISDECYEQFVSIVSNCRNISLEKTREIADGRIYSAKQALENDLIDFIDSEENMMKSFIERKLGKTGVKVKEFIYKKNLTFMETLMDTATKISSQQVAAKIGVPANVINDLYEFNSYPAFLYQK